MTDHFLGYVASILILLILWQVGSWALTVAYQDPRDIVQIVRFFPGPDIVFSYMLGHAEEIAKHLLGTTYRLLIALIISLFFAIPLGLYIGHAAWAKRYLTPFIYAVYPIPKVVFWPVLFIIFHISQATEDLSKIIFIILVVFFQLLISTRDAAENVPKEYVVSAIAAGVTPRQIYWDVILPGSLPAIFSSLRVSLGFGIFAAYIAETQFVIGRPEFGGLGYYIDSSGLQNSKGVYAGIVVIAMLGLAIYIIIELLERWLCRWKYVGQDVQH